jgi:hypothetical protein
LLFSRIKSRYTYLHIATKVENNFYGFQLYRSWRIEILDLECVLMKSFQPLFSEFWRALEFFLSWLCTSFWFLSWNDFILRPLQFASQYGPVLFLMFIVQTSNLNELSWNVLGFVRTAQALHFWVLIWNLEFEILSSFLPLQWLWIWSPTNSLGELNIFGHNGYPFRVKCAKIGVFKESDQISLRSLLQC